MKEKSMSYPVIIRCVVTAVILFFILNAYLYADTIVLKSGKVLEGEILEYGYGYGDEFLKIQWQGQILSIPLHDIDNIDGAAPKIPEWVEGKKIFSLYVHTVEGLYYECVKITMLACIFPGSIRYGYDEDLSLVETRSKLVQFSKELRGMIPPNELKEHHQKLIEGCGYLIKSLGEGDRIDTVQYLHYRQKEINARIEFSHYLKEVYRRHNYPQEALDQIDMVITLCNEQRASLKTYEIYYQVIESASSGKFDEARAQLDEARRKKELLYVRQPYYKILKDIKKGKISEDYALYYFKGENAFNNNQFQKAIIAFQKAIEINPDSYEAYLSLASTYIALGEKEKANETSKKAFELERIGRKGFTKRIVDVFNFWVYNLVGRMYFCHPCRINKDTIQMPSQIPSLKPKTLDKKNYIFYIPSDCNLNKFHPLVIALSPTADTQSMLNTWKNVAESKKWFIYASKTFRNAIPVRPILKQIYSDIYHLSLYYPIDTKRIIAGGMSGGGMGGHFFSYYYRNLVSAVIVNTGMIDSTFKSSTYGYPRNKIVVFLASPTDFRYEEMNDDRKFLESLDWNIKWIEFEGGHIIAPESVYQEAADWLQEQLE